MVVSEDVLRIWLREAKQFLHRYWDHPAYDDIVAEAYLTMWEAITAAEPNAVRDLKAYAMRAAWNGAQAFLSSPRNEHRTYSVFKRKETAPVCYLQDIIAGRHEDWCPYRLIEPDFAPALIERIAAEDELTRLQPAKRAALLLCCCRGLTREEARRQLGFSRTKIDKLLARVPRSAIPYAHPGPGVPRWWERQRDERGCFR
jgi:RNA polymerase sigma factor (sigma-70 family)